MTINNERTGLIAIEEAELFANQEVIFSIPVPDNYNRKIQHLNDIHKYIQDGISANIYNNGKIQPIFLEFDTKDNVLFYKSKNGKVFFYVNKEINLKIEDTKGLYSKILKLIFNFFSIPYNNSKLINSYVGTKYRERFKNHKFIILTLNNPQELDRIFIKENIFFVN